jgi:hypothetical protein
MKSRFINEATGDGASGSFRMPLQPKEKKWKKNILSPFDIEIGNEQNKSNIDTQSKKAKYSERPKVAFFKNGKEVVSEWVEISDDVIIKEIKNENPLRKLIKKVLKEADSSTTAGLYNGPMELGLKKWKHHLKPFEIEVDHHHNEKSKKSKLKDNIITKVGVWEKNSDGTYNNPTHDAGGTKQTKINEDLAVWFGKKKKPKGSSQPKGPWVNICKKVDGKHPPCGRKTATDKAYPKCRAAGVAGKMSDSQKRAACAQKRKAEKTHSKSGTGNKPKLVSYKPRKK